MLFLSDWAIRAPEYAYVCSRTINTMPFTGAPMSFDSSANYQEVQQAERREKLVAVLAASLGVLIVAAIAIVMGMA
jgi:hypothetical protein